MYVQEINILPLDEVEINRNLALSKRRSHFIFPHRLADGAVRTVEVHSSPIEHNGELMLFSIIHDITDRKEAEDAMRESRENLLSLFETVDDIIVVGAQDGKILHTNSAASRKLGYTRDELKTMHMLDLNPKSQRQEAERILSKMYKGDRNTCPLPLEKKDGTIIPAEIRVWLGNWSGVDSIFGICKDISTEQEALQKFNKFFELNPSPMAVSSLSDRKFMEVNESWLNTLGFSRDEVIGKTSAELGILVDPEKQQDFAKRLLDQGSVRDIELQIRKKDGTILEGIFSGETIDSQGRNYFVTAMLDVTERKRLEQKRLDMERKLLHAQKLESLGVMAGGIAHDFNNLLQVVLGNLDIALDNTPPDSKVRQSILNAIQASERSAKLSGQMLTYSGSSFHIPKEIDLNELLNKSRNLFKSYIHENTILKYDVSKTLPRIKGDQDQIQRLINNLVVNALEAIGEKQGEVRVSAGTVECDEEYLSGNRLDIKLEPGVLVFLEVSDTGDGMDDKTLQRLFDPFFSTKFWGRGLGMAEVMGIGKAHHGAIFVDSETGKGTTIRVLFPVSEKVQESPIQVKGAVETKPAAPVSPTGRKTILVVDDEEMVRGLVLGRLEVLGYDTIAAVDGAEGVHIFREHMNEIDLVILDFAMPKMNGVEAFEELIRIKPDVKVILSSGYTEDIVLQSFPDRRPAGILHKPYKTEDLKAALDRLLGTDG
jgi:PAS domain S-box-containing protein